MKPWCTAPRIASLVPSATELLVALGLRPWMVARTGFCIHPADAVRDLPKVGGTKDVRLERLQALAPTHVVLNPDENLRSTFDSIQAWPGVQCLVTHPQGPHDVPTLIAQCAAPFEALPGVRDAAARLQAALAVALQAPPHSPRGRVLYLVWRRPWMTVARDTYIAQLLGSAGWQTWPAVDGGPLGATRYPTLAEDDPVWRQVDEVWLASEPYAFTEAHRAEVQALAPQARLRWVDGECCSWWGARTAAGLAYVRGLAA